MEKFGVEFFVVRKSESETAGVSSGVSGWTPAKLTARTWVFDQGQALSGPVLPFLLSRYFSAAGTVAALFSVVFRVSGFEACVLACVMEAGFPTDFFTWCFGVATASE